MTLKQSLAYFAKETERNIYATMTKEAFHIKLKSVLDPVQSLLSGLCPNIDNNISKNFGVILLVKRHKFFFICAKRKVLLS